MYHALVRTYVPSTDKLASACAASLCTSGSIDLVRGTNSLRPPYCTI